MLTESEVRKSVTKAVLTKDMVLWGMLRSISTFGPLLATYIFAEGIAAIEEGDTLNTIIGVFLVLLVIEVVEHFFRVLSKAKMAYYTESSMIAVQDDLITSINPSDKVRKETIQTLRNLTQATRRFIEFMYNNGLQGIVSLISIPIILYFIDSKIFLLEMILISIYLVFTFYFSKLYEKRFEKFDESREKYFSHLLEKNHVTRQSNVVLKDFRKVKEVFFVDWFSLQSIVSLFIFLMTYLVVKDIFGGFKEISDLVLIIGYAKETKMFLNNTTGAVNSYMEIKAGVERVSASSKLEGLATHKS